MRKTKLILPALLAMIGSLTLAGCGKNNASPNSDGSVVTPGSVPSGDESQKPGSDLLPSNNDSTSTEEPPVTPDAIRPNKAWVDLPFITLSSSNVKVRVSFADSLSLSFKFTGNEKDEHTLNVTYGNDTIESKAYEIDGDEVVMAVNDLSLVDVKTKFSVTIKSNDQIIDSLELNVLDYINKLLTMDQETLGLEKLDFLGLQNTLISYLNYVGKMEHIQGVSDDELASKDLTQEQLSNLFDSKSQNHYHVEWGLRDNFTIIEGSNHEKFNWIRAELKYDKGNYLTYKFEVTSNSFTNLKAQVAFGDEFKDVEVYKLNEEGDKEIYAFDTPAYDLLESHKMVKAVVFDGSTQISSKVGFSLTRAMAYADHFGSDEDKVVSTALYSLVKSATWWSMRDEISYNILPAVNDNGICTFSLFEYTYDDAKFLIEKQFDTFGAYLYTQGVVCDSNNPNVSGEGFEVSYENNTFTLTLNGCTLDGILVKNGANLIVNVEGDSVIKSALFRSWNDKNSQTSASIISDSGNVTIESKNKSKLQINGGIYAPQDLNIKDVNVDINNDFANRSTGIYSEGNIVIDSANLHVFGYDTALYLKDAINEETIETEQTLQVLGDSSVELVGKEYGINSHNLNRELVFEDGEILIEGNNGINYGNITVNKAKLTVIAHNGYVVEANKPVTITTTSEDYEVGEIHFINETPHNEWWDVNYVLKVKDMNINGGTIYVEGYTRNGLIILEENANMTLENCDVFITSLNDGTAINANNSKNGTITIEKAGQLIITGCDIPIGCWNSESPVKVYVNGNFEVYSFRGAIGEWEDTTSVQGEIVYHDRREG